MNSFLRQLGLAVLVTAAFSLSSCGGGHSGSSNTSANGCSNVAGLSASFGNPSGINVVPVTIDQGPVPSQAPALNQAFVSITVCTPGASVGSSGCQTIDHVWIDTGSSGLKIVSSVLTVPLPLSSASTTPIGSCGQFVNSYTWGALRTADIHVGGETATSMPIQVVGDSAVPSTAPSLCSNGTPAMSVVSDFSANALLGIGLFLQDCGLTCAQGTGAHFYWSCPSTTSACTEITMPVNQQVQNVVGLFPTDNNGSLMQIPEIPATGQATASGWLIFGINTQTNNQLGSALIFQADPTGFSSGAAGIINTTTTYGTTSNPSSFIDSGSNGYFIDDPTLTSCGSPNQAWFCSTAQLAATMTTCVGTDCAGFTAVSNTYDFCVADFNNLNGAYAAFNDVGGSSGNLGSSSNGSFDWGFPFFYGRSVFTAVETATLNGTTGPFFAASTP